MKEVTEVELFSKLKSVRREFKAMFPAFSFSNNEDIYPRKLDEYQLKRIRFLGHRFPLFKAMQFSIATLALILPRLLLYSFKTSIDIHDLKKNRVGRSKVPLILISHGIKQKNALKPESFLDGFLRALNPRTKYRVLLIPHFSRIGLFSKLTLQDNYSIINRNSNINESFNIIYGNLMNSMKLLSKSFFRSNICGEFRSYLAKAALNQFSSMSITIDQIAANAIKKIAEVEAQTVVLPYEGHPQELSLIKGIQCNLPHVRILLIQHAPLSPSQCSFIEGLKLLRNQDYLLVSGELVKKAIVLYDSELESSLIVLGSSKYLDSEESKSEKIEFSSTAIIAPESTTEATEEILDCIMESYQKLPIERFTLRVHPNFDGKFKYRTDFEQTHRFSISNSSLDFDLRSNSICFYRGSAVAFQAMMLGLFPVFCSKLPRSLLDPLSLITPFMSRETAIWIREFPSKDKYDGGMPLIPEAVKSELMEIGRSYFSPISQDILKWIESL